MPTTPYAQILVSENGGPLLSGLQTVTNTNVIQCSAANVTGWINYRWEIYDYPVGFSLPSGWADDGTGVFYSLALTPPTFTIPASPMWGNFALRLRINEALTSSKAAQNLTDEATILRVFSPGLGMEDIAQFQSNQGHSSWLKILQADFRLIDGIIVAGGGGPPTGAAGGDLSATFPNPTVAKIHGGSVPLATGMTTGNGLYASGAAAFTLSALNLAGGSGWVTGQLPVVNFAPGSNGQVLTTATGAATWATLVDANISSSAAIAPSKLGQASATSGQVLAWSGSAWAPATPSVSLAGLASGGASTGQALIWTGSAWAPGSNFGAQNILTSGTLGAGAGTFTSLTDSGLGLGVVHSSSGGAFTSSLLVNADVSASAAIAGTKVSPAFGSQNISTTGTLSAGATTVTGLTDSALGAGVVHSSAGGVLSIALVDLTTEVTGVLPAANLPASASTGQIVATLAALALLDTATFADTTQCGVATLLDSFTLRKTDTQTPDGIKVIAAKSGGGTVGNWVRNERPHPAWLLVTDWYVTSGGNDEALGDATHQLASPEEVLRRIGPSAVLPAVTIHVQATLASTKPFDIPRSVRAPLGLTIVGTPTQVATGTLTAVGAAVPASATKYKVTASGLAGGFGPHVGRLMRNTTVGARFGTYWFIGANLGSGIAEVSSPGSSVPIGGITAQVLGAFTLLPPVNGDTFEILTLPQVTVRGIEPEGTVFSTFLDYQCNGAAPVTGYLSACKIDKAAIVGPSGNCAWSQVYYSGSTVIRFARFFFAACWGEIDGSVGSMTFTGCRANSDNDNILNGATMSLVQSEMDLTSAAVFNAPLDGFSVDSGSTLRLPSPSAIWGTGNGRVGVLVRAGSKVASNVGGLYYCNLGLGAQREVLLGDRYVLYNMLPARAINSGADWGEIRNPF